MAKIRKTSTLLGAALVCALVGGAVSPAMAATTDPSDIHGDGFVPTTTQQQPRLTLKAAQNARGNPQSVDLRAWAPTPGDQGYFNSCVSWVLGHNISGWYANKMGTSTEFAPLYIYSQTHVSNSVDGGGSYVSDAMSVIQNQGVDTLADYQPQGQNDFNTRPTDAQRANAANYKTLGYNRLFSLYSGNAGEAGQALIENSLVAEHPVGLAIPIYNSFYYLDDNDYTFDLADATGSIYGYHYITVVGYDETGVWVENSWGTNWGQRGFAHLNWNFVNTKAIEAESVYGFAASTLPTPPAATPQPTASETPQPVATTTPAPVVTTEPTPQETATTNPEPVVVPTAQPTTEPVVTPNPVATTEPVVAPNPVVTTVPTTQPSTVPTTVSVVTPVTPVTPVAPVNPTVPVVTPAPVHSVTPVVPTPVVPNPVATTGTVAYQPVVTPAPVSSSAPVTTASTPSTPANDGGQVSTLPAASISISSAPRNLNTAVTTDTVNVSWTTPAKTGGDISGYEVTVAGDTTHVIAAVNTGVSVTGLTPDTAYAVKVRAINAAGYSVALTTTARTLGIAPKVAAVSTSVKNGILTTTWQPKAVKGGGAIVKTVLTIALGKKTLASRTYKASARSAQIILPKTVRTGTYKLGVTVYAKHGHVTATKQVKIKR